jgi:hypothetical protein
MAKTLVSQVNIRTVTVRATAALTTSYVSSDSFNIQGANQIQLLISFDKGDSDGCRLKIDFSEDETDWYQETTYTVEENGDVIHKPVFRKLESTSNIVIPTPVSSSFFRVSSAAILTGSNTLLSIAATIANI